MISYNTLVVLLGTGLLGISCGLVGTFAVLRRRALTGDALSHAALPGLGLAFLIAGHASLPILLLGALLSGLAGVGVIAALRHWTRVKEDAAIGIVLSVFFGAGIVLSNFIQRHMTGGSSVNLKAYILGQTAAMIAQDVYLIAAGALLSLVLVLLLYKELKLVAFDRQFAQVAGWPAFALDLVLMSLVAVSVIIGLPAVGVVLVTALLILPAAAARFWTERLGVMLGLAALFGLIAGVTGTILSGQFTWLPTGPIIVLVGTVLFLLSLLLAPQRGSLARWLAQRRFRRRLAEQTLLRTLFELVEPHLPAQSVITLADLQRHHPTAESSPRQLLSAAERQGWLQLLSPTTLQLTAEGLRQAAHVTHNHRLWKLYLTEYADTASSVADLDAETLTERVPADVLRDLRVQLRSKAAGRRRTA